MQTWKQLGLAAVLSLVVAGVGSVIWSVLLIANAKASPSIPWSVAVMAVVLAVLVVPEWARRTRKHRAHGPTSALFAAWQRLRCNLHRVDQAVVHGASELGCLSGVDVPVPDPRISPLRSAATQPGVSCRPAYESQPRRSSSALEGSREC